MSLFRQWILRDVEDSHTYAFVALSFCANEHKMATGTGRRWAEGWRLGAGQHWGGRHRMSVATHQDGNRGRGTG